MHTCASRYINRAVPTCVSLQPCPICHRAYGGHKHLLLHVYCKLLPEYESQHLGNLSEGAIVFLSARLGPLLHFTDQSIRCDLQIDWRPLLPQISIPCMNLRGLKNGVFPPEGTAVVSKLVPDCKQVDLSTLPKPPKLQLQHHMCSV